MNKLMFITTQKFDNQNLLAFERLKLDYNKRHVSPWQSPRDE